jgi:hypothetical protein
MVKSRAEMMERVGRLLTEYAEFQRGRPDLPQGDLLELSEEEFAEFQRDGATEADDTDPTPPRPLSIEHRLAPVTDPGWDSLGKAIHRRRAEPSSSKV